MTVEVTDTLRASRSLAAVLGVAGITAACGSLSGSAAGSMHFATQRQIPNMNLSTAAGSDPRPYLGRFAFDIVAPDEAGTLSLACSGPTYFEIVALPGADFEMHDKALVSARGAATLGFNALDFGASASDAYYASIDYKVKRKFVASPKNPEEFQACCRMGADRCGVAYISEFVVGDGAVTLCRSNRIVVDVGYKVVEGSAGREDAECQSSKFRDVAFAFRLTPSGPCAELDSLARRGEPIVQTGWVATEKQARDNAERDAKRAAGLETGSAETLRVCVESRPLGQTGVFEHRGKALALARRSGTATTTGWSLVGLGAAAIVAGGGMLTGAFIKANDAIDARNAGQNWRTLDADAQDLQRASWLTGAAGAVVGGAGVWILLARWDDTDSSGGGDAAAHPHSSNGIGWSVTW